MSEDFITLLEEFEKERIKLKGVHFLSELLFCYIRFVFQRLIFVWLHALDGAVCVVLDFSEHYTALMVNTAG